MRTNDLSRSLWVACWLSRVPKHWAWNNAPESRKLSPTIERGDFLADATAKLA
eukprot:CAMPEP_0183313998 /NCGR_PEP_ID=MMETSP0160_2-20130417/47177_1 /TAXON_ID=2839 ORGANISM="Odontella Sinensis, Strain Grunow 1884" /NCGR_SAMPLE_ID=MMETSP0160_2 /ASSEMBLY_ACC=CAM_ASM_000250 /LENGTH=52 /DNA_ID=CAMNT_0025479211 /DNA_START=215 /DNA_END=369 /DNA_ORIENTATION=+